MNHNKQGNNKIPIGACPECDADIVFKKQPKVDQEIICPGCGSKLRVISLSPIELDWPNETDEVEDYDQ